MGLRIYNTLSRTKEPFETLEPGVVTMYVCGPTVYSEAHVGHAMSVLVFDVIRRYLEFRGYRVKHVMNYTDIDDKIIQRANAEQVDPFALADRHAADYEQHLQDLNILKATAYPRVSQEVPRIVAFIERLIEKGLAYPAAGSVYFRVGHFEQYGALSGRRLSEIQPGGRVESEDQKENPADFALWKATRPGEPAWDSPWGPGRPGWHIECSTMCLHFLGETIDIHGGGNDLIFPHHENELAQTESLTGRQFVRYWVHNGMLQLAGEKMSKSLGNLVTITDFLEEHEADVLRMVVLNAGYRKPLAFDEAVIQQGSRSLRRLRAALRPPEGAAPGASPETIAFLARQVEDTKQRFTAAMDDDFNSAGALAGLFDLARVINQGRDAGATDSELAEAQALLAKLGGVLGLRLGERRPVAGSIVPLVDLLLEVRSELRAARQWQLADMIRERLAELGILLEDGKEGSSWHLE